MASREGGRRSIVVLAFLVAGFPAFGAVAISLSTAAPLSATAAGDRAIVGVAQDEAQRQLGRVVVLDVRSLKQRNGWAFLLSRMQDVDGTPVDLRGTRLEGAAHEGVASRVFCALLRSRNARWTIVATCLGATDVAWTG